MEENNQLENATAFLTAEVMRRVTACANDTAKIATVLKDIKLPIVKNAAQMQNFTYDTPDGLETIWQIAAAMPNIQLLPSGERRMSSLSLAVSVIAGWLAGGVLSGLLDFISLGGDIIRAGAIFASVWLTDYIGTNATVRARLLNIFGWSAIGAGITRITLGTLRFGNWRAILAGSGKTGFFRSFWLLLGIIFFYVFFAGKRSSNSKICSEKDISEQIRQKLQFLSIIFKKLTETQQQLENLAQQKLAEKNSSAETQALVMTIMEILPGLPKAQKEFLTQKLSLAGINVSGEAENFFYWQENRDRKLYDTLGIVKDGDRCIAIRKPIEQKKEIIKGVAQRSN